MNYTKPQQEAIDTLDRNLQIIACAGSGKTEVVAARVAGILGSGASPANVVAFTFTDRAGAELKDRIGRRVQERLGNVTGMAEMYVGTIHGFCLGLLQAYVPKYFKFSVLNEVQARLLVDRATQRTGLADVGLKRFVDSRLYIDVLSTLREGDPNMQILRGDTSGEKALRALEKYGDYLDERRYLDFTEVMVQAVVEVMENSVLRSELSARVKYLIVDEYQDVNPLQECLIRELHGLGANLCVVGDDDQTIYQWRGSSVRNILTFTSRYHNVKTVTIDENYRSSDGIVGTARRVIEHNPNRLTKTMKSAGSQTFARGDVLSLTFDSLTDEAKWIARKAKEMLGMPFVDRPGEPPRGLAPSDIAILLRSVKRNGEPIVEALQEEGLPVIVVGMAELFHTPEAQAAAAIFQYMASNISETQLRQAWDTANLGIVNSDLDAGVDPPTYGRTFTPGARFGVYNLQRTYLNFLVLRSGHSPTQKKILIPHDINALLRSLSPGQQRVAQALAQSPTLTYPALAFELDLHLGTIHTHLRRIRLRNLEAYAALMAVRQSGLAIRHEGALKRAEAHSRAWHRKRANRRYRQRFGRWPWE